MTKKIRLIPETTFAQQCFERLQEEIIEGVLKPGEKLKVLNLKKSFGIGQSPIREALSRLVSLGLVEVTDNKGFRVAPVSEENIRDIYATFTLIENAALKLAIEKGNEKWKKKVNSEFKKLAAIENKKSEVPYSEWSKQNYKFHYTLISACDSPELLNIQWNLYLKFERYVRMAYQISSYKEYKNYREEKRQDHEKLVDLVLNQKINDAIKLMTYHINAPMEDIIAILKKKQLI